MAGKKKTKFKLYLAQGAESVLQAWEELQLPGCQCGSRHGGPFRAGAAEWREKFEKDRAEIEVTAADADRRNDHTDQAFRASHTQYDTCSQHTARRGGSVARANAPASQKAAQAPAKG